jgi:LacI family transcriptional regulator
MEPVRYVVDTGSADGVIISRTQPNDPRVRYMVDHSMPFVTHGRTSMGIDHAYHDFDNAAFSLAAVRRLHKLGRKRIALLAPPPTLSYHHHMRDGFLEGLAELGLTEVPFTSVTVDHSIDDIRAHARQLMNRAARPDGVVSGSGGATFALVAGLEDAGLKLGRDIDIVSKQSSRLLHFFRPELHVVNEDVRLAGFELAKAVTGSIARADLKTLQSLKAPPPIETRGQLAEAAAAS